MHFFQAIVDLPFPVLEHWGYVIVGLAAFVEALPLFGVFVPGHMLVIAGGFFAREKVLDLATVFTVSIIGAILGDVVGYWIGRRFGDAFIERFGRYFFFKPEHLLKTKQLVNEHPGKAIILGRYNLVTRAFAPFVAGMSRLPFRKFLFFNLVGGVTWAGSSVLLGFAFGASYELGARYFGLVVFSVLMVVTIVHIYRYYRKQKV